MSLPFLTYSCRRISLLWRSTGSFGARLTFCRKIAKGLRGLELYLWAEDVVLNESTRETERPPIPGQVFRVSSRIMSFGKLPGFLFG
jgi:hypothetical protein